MIPPRQSSVDNGTQEELNTEQEAFLASQPEVGGTQLAVCDEEHGEDEVRGEEGDVAHPLMENGTTDKGHRQHHRFIMKKMRHRRRLYVLINWNQRCSRTVVTALNVV